MKKKTLISIVIVCCVVVIAGVVALAIANNQTHEGLLVVDGQGETLALLQADMVLDEDEKQYHTYIEVAIQEAIEKMAEKENCTQEEIERELFNGKYTLYTAFDKKAFVASNDAYKSTKFEDIPFASVVTAHDGRILSIYNCENRENVNYAIEKTQAYSAFKPLSVYAPAIENETIVWTSSFLDSPVKEIFNEETGELTEWPTNGTGSYKNTAVSISEGIKKSLNTTAIRALQELGVKKSTDFLTEKLGVDLSLEIQTMKKFGEDEILGAIGLGYLRTGVSPVDMAGYYQIFVRGGEYTEPYTVLKIKKGIFTAYENKNVSKEVISEETSFIMNKLLQKTTEKGGTAEKAQYEDVKIGAKTGTGSYYAGNWIVGYTPEYICSIWHGRNRENLCAKTFSVLMSGLEHDRTKEFATCEAIVEVPLCKESGQKLTMDCKQMETGYFKSGTDIKTCEIHKK